MLYFNLQAKLIHTVIMFRYTYDSILYFNNVKFNARGNEYRKGNNNIYSSRYLSMQEDEFC